MLKIIEVESRKEMVFSLPSSSVEGNLFLIKMLCSYVGVDLTDSDLLRIMEFVFHTKYDSLVFIINGEGISFLPSTVFFENSSQSLN